MEQICRTSASPPWQLSISADELVTPSSCPMDSDPLSLQLQYALLGGSFSEQEWAHSSVRFDNCDHWLLASAQSPLDYSPSFPSLSHHPVTEEDSLPSPHSPEASEGVPAPQQPTKNSNGVPPPIGTKAQSDVGACPSSRKRAKRRSADPSEPKYMIVTRSEVEELLDDGFRWRKYGQKCVKNSHYPRSYYRCSYVGGCNAQKHVQRCPSDNSLVWTTYQGRHTHRCPLK